MELFHEIPDAQAIVRCKGGVYKQVKLYRRGPHKYVGLRGGFVRILTKFGDTWPTSNPDTTVVDLVRILTKFGDTWPTPGTTMVDMS